MGSIISDSKPLEADFVPPSLPHREKEMQTLDRMFYPMVKYNSPANAMVMGKSGMGKTALVRRFMDFLEGQAEENEKKVKCVYVSCMDSRTDYSILLKVMKGFDPGYPGKGRTMDEIKNDLRSTMSRDKVHLIVVLDEANLLQKDTELIYLFTRSKTLEYGTISLILISIVDIRDRMNDQELGTFGRSTMVHLKDYDRTQLRDILDQRIELALHPDTVTEGAEELILDGACERNSEARVVVELLRKSASAAEKDGAEQIMPDHVRLAKADSYPWVSISKIGMLDFDAQILLFTIAGCLRKDEAYIGTDELRDFYADACGRNNVRVNRDIYFKNLDALEKEGFVDVWEMKGQASLVSLPDCPAYGVEEMVLEVWKRTGQKYTA
ncbi:MAG: AAA family ATPase [Thermoplasmatales archaeon]|nr:AAA family ATPase [Thermoplasmatales archaeon]